MKQLYILALSFISIGSLQAQLSSVTGFGKTGFLKTSSQFLAPTQTTEQTSNITIYPVPLTDTPSSILLEAANGAKAKDFFQYEDGKVTEIIEKIWGSDSWMNYVKQTYIYNNQDYLNEMSIYTWNGNSWAEYSKNEYTSNESGQILTIIEYVPLNNAWFADVYYQFLYEQDANTIVMIKQTRLANESEWENMQKFRYTYNSSGKITMEEVDIWNGEDWQKLQRATLSYNSNGRDLLWDIKSFNTNIILDTKYNFNYNQNQQIATVNQIVSFQGNWISYLSFSYDYTNSSVYNEKIFPYNISVALHKTNLVINSPEEETIFIYSASGALINQFEKNAGEANCPFSVQNGIYLVKGSSGWVKKVMKI